MKEIGKAAERDRSIFDESWDFWKPRVLQAQGGLLGCPGRTGLLSKVEGHARLQQPFKRLSRRTTDSAL